MNSPSTPRIAAANQAIYANPDQDYLRLVLGDLLLERGDPRGDLIAEQSRRATKGLAQETKRERDLQKKHGDTWLGPIASALKAFSFRLGFLSSATIRGGKHDFKTLSKRPEWRTLERLKAGTNRQAGSVPELTAQKILSLEQLVSLREVDTVFVSVLERVLEIRSTVPWESLRAVQITNPEEDFALLGEMGKGLPSLKRLECHDEFLEGELDEPSPDVYATFFSTPLVSRLELLKLDCDESVLDVVANAAIASKIARVTIGCPRSTFWNAQIVWDSMSRTMSVPKGVHLPVQNVAIVRTEG